MNSGIRYECGKCGRRFIEYDIKFVGFRLINGIKIRNRMFNLCKDCTTKLYNWLEEEE